MRKTGRLQRRLLQGSLGWRWGSFAAGIEVTRPWFAGRGCKPRSGWRAARRCGSPCLFLESERIWPGRLGKRRRSVEAEAEEFPPVARLVGNSGARTAPSLLPSAGCSQGTRWQRALLWGGRALARSKPGAVPRARCRSGPCRQRSGEATGLAWLGERQFCFLFFGQGGMAAQTASAAGSPAPSRTGSKREVAQLEICF